MELGRSWQSNSHSASLSSLNQKGPLLYSEEPDPMEHTYTGPFSQGSKLPDTKQNELEK
jgi:hypothetical protein